MATSKFLVPAVIVIVLLVVGTGAGLYLTSGSGSNTNSTSSGGPSKVVQVVAGENFWGNLVSQLGGTHVHVVSIVSDPNVDPHQYESSSANAQAVANANLVIVNGAGYDDWLPASFCKQQPCPNCLECAKADRPTSRHKPAFLVQSILRE